MALGDIDMTRPYLLIDGETKTNTAVTRGDLLQYDTDGWFPAVQAVGPADDSAIYGVCLDTEAAVGGTQVKIRVLLRGVVQVAKNATEAMEVGQAVMVGAAAGEVDLFAVADVGGTFVQADVNDAIADVTEKVGMCWVAVGSSVVVVSVLMGW